MIEHRLTSSEKFIIAESRKLMVSASIEVTAGDSVAETLAHSFPHRRKKVGITCSESQSIESSLEFSSSLMSEGFKPVPHIAAHQVNDMHHLNSISEKLMENGVDEIFVIRGDAKRRGEYGSSLKLLTDLSKTGVEIRNIGIAGHPEGFPGMDRKQIIDGIKKREEAAFEMGVNMYIVTQMCFDADKILRYAEDLKRNGLRIPVVVGLAGTKTRQEVYDIANRCGVGKSKEKLLAGNMDDQYDPTGLVDDIALRDESRLISRYHFYTFNNINELSDRLGRLGNI